MLLLISAYCLFSSKSIFNLLYPIFTIHTLWAVSFILDLLSFSIIFILVNSFEYIASQRGSKLNYIFVGAVVLTILIYLLYMTLIHILYKEGVFFPSTGFFKHRSIVTIVFAGAAIPQLRFCKHLKKVIGGRNKGLHENATFETLELLRRFCLFGLITAVASFVILGFIIPDLKEHVHKIFLVSVNIYILLIILRFSFVSFRNPQNFLALFVQIKNIDLAITVSQLLENFNEEGRKIEPAPKAHDKQSNNKSIPDSLTASDTEPKKPHNDSRVKSPLPTETISKIINFIENEKVFLNENLNPKAVAEQLKLPAYYVRKAIKQKYNSTFASYINLLRIREAERILKTEEYSHYTISSIGEMCGFNSDTAFYRNFNKFANSNPSDYRKNN